jgi:uncharacterized membrane protein YbhN (UPF0104 family)
MLKKRIILAVQFLFFLGLGLFLVWWMARGIDDKGWIQIKASLQQANYWLFVPVFAMLLLSHYVRALRWKILMQPLGYKPGTFNVFNAVMIGYLANLAFPRLGEVLKCTLLARYEKMAPDKLIGTIVAERAVDLVCLITAFVITILLQIDTVGSYALNTLQDLFRGGDREFSWLRVGMLIGIIVSFLLVCYWLLKRFSHIRIIERIKNVLKGIWHGLNSIRYIKQRRLFLIHTALIWTLYFLSSRVGFYAMEEVSHLGTREAFSILSFGSVGMIATQGGIGAYQFIVQEILMLYGLSQITGFTFGWILWIAQTLVVLLGGLVCFILLPVLNRKRNESNKTYSAENT